MNIDQLISSIRDDEPQQNEIDSAAARVRGRVFPASPSSHQASPAGAIRGCDDFVSLIPAYLSGNLDPARRLLLEVHTRECANCRRAFDRVRSGANNVVEFRNVRKPSAIRYAGWAAAAAVLIVAGGTTYWTFVARPSSLAGSRATVETVDGALYKVTGASLTPLVAGAQLRESDSVRTAKNSTAIVRLSDGSKIELNQRAEISVTGSGSGPTIHLAQGNIIVEAAKQRRGTLQVATADCNVSVKGTVFSVDSGTKGSRVAVVEGTVWVDHGANHDVLHRGDSTSTAADMQPVPIREQFEWSRNSAQYLALLGDLREIKRQIEQIPAPTLRYESKLLAWLPANVAALAAVPNIGGTVGEASRIFHERLNQSESLKAWWSKLPTAQREQFDATAARVETAGAYLGTEVVLAVLTTASGQPSPVIIAEMTKSGLESYLRQQLPAKVFDGHMRFENGIFAAASDSSDLDRIKPAGDFLRTSLYQRIAPSYRQGAGWLFAADLQQIGHANLAGARYLIAESRTLGRDTQNRASIIFNQEREGIASWLAAPAPMGSLDFISPDAGFSISMMLKSPSAIVPDLAKFMPQAKIDPVLLTELAGAFGGEITIALDGPLLPLPSWKIAAEVYSPDRIQSFISKLIVENPDLKLTQSEEGNQIFYRLSSDKYPWEADWTFLEGYWIAAANRELLVRSIQNRQTGYTLQRSTAFRNQLPSDTSTNFSAVLFHNLGQTLAPLAGLIDTPFKNDTPGVVCFWAKQDRIDVAAKGLINLDALLSMKTLTPGGMIAQALQPARKSAGGRR